MRQGPTLSRYPRYPGLVEAGLDRVALVEVPDQSRYPWAGSGGVELKMVTVDRTPGPRIELDDSDCIISPATKWDPAHPVPLTCPADPVPLTLSHKPCPDPVPLTLSR